MGKIKDRIGIRYDRLIVIKFAGRDWDGAILWLCKCDCGNEKIIKGGNLESKTSRSCGCFEQKLKEQRIGERNPNYIDGRTKTKLKLKEKIRKRDNYICQDCGMTQKEHEKRYNKILEVHHIDGDDTNDTEENMITLCHSCHRKKG